VAVKNTGAQNAITDDNFGTELPTTQIDEIALAGERSMARFSKTKEYKALKDYMETRIEFFQKYLPTGAPLTVGNLPHANKDWIVANTVIGEFKNVLQAYENAAEAVRAAQNN
jgi:hypothetical protein